MHTCDAYACQFRLAARPAVPLGPQVLFFEVGVKWIATRALESFVRWGGRQWNGLSTYRPYATNAVISPPATA
jgi:hypothetical protein